MLYFQSEVTRLTEENSRLIMDAVRTPEKQREIGSRVSESVGVKPGLDLSRSASLDSCEPGPGMS